MENFELLLHIALAMVAPVLLIIIISRLRVVYQNGICELDWIDVINLLNCIYLPWNLIVFYGEQPENFMRTLWPSGLNLLFVITVLMLICLISEFYTEIKTTPFRTAFVGLFPFASMTGVGYAYVSGYLPFGQMVALTLALILVTVSVCSLGPVYKEFKLRQLRKTLEDEHRNILQQNERKYRRLKTKELENLLDEYLKLHPDDYAKYDRYSKDKRYPRPLVSGKEIIDLRINVINKELRSRAWNR